jgi:hypothetical protein
MQATGYKINYNKNPREKISLEDQWREGMKS